MPDRHPKSKGGAPRARGLWRVLRRGLVADERGVTAIEFGILALPFFAVIAAILETSMSFLGAQILDSGVDISVRELRTGQIQSSGDNTMSHYRSVLCDHLYGLFDCSQLHIDVQKITDFSSATMGSPIDPDDGTWTLAENYHPGDGSDIVMVKVYYKWPTLLDFYNFNLANTPDGKQLLSAVRVYKNEPFSASSTSGG